MDSMKSLNKSLPQDSNQLHAQPPEQLLQAFKAAALSVTNLYKVSAADHAQIRHGGFQEALDNLLAFLDNENLGLGDGEGWRVRQWATSRLDGSPPVHAGSDTDDDRAETTKRARSSSPTLQRKSSQDTLRTRQPSRSASPSRVASAPLVTPVHTPQLDTFSRPGIFSFRSSHPFPPDVDMQADTTTSSTSQPEPQPQGPGSTITPAVRLEMVSQRTRTPHRSGIHSNRHNTRSSTSTRSLGSGAGSKRKITYNDYFDLDSFGDGKDGSGVGGKRGRFI